MELDTLRRQWLRLTDAMAAAHAGSERGGHPPPDRAQTERWQAARDAYTAALAVARRDDPSAFAAWVESMRTEADSPGLRRRKSDMKHGIWWDWMAESAPGWSPSVTVRAEAAGDEGRVDALVAAAFGRDDEARQVGRLRGQGGVISLVAERDGVLVGHAMLSPVTCPAPQSACALTPVAVAPQAQQRGVGSALVQQTLKAAWGSGLDACFVLGSPRYFGAWFKKAAPRWRSPRTADGATLQIALRHWVTVDMWDGGEVVFHPELSTTGA